jgi:hypothetical protein
MMLRAIVCGLVLLAPFPAAAGPPKGDEKGVKKGAEGELGALKQKFQERVKALQKSFIAAKAEEEKEKIQTQFFEMAADYAEGLSKFADQHKNDEAGKLASKELMQILPALAQSDSPAVAKSLRRMLEKSTQKDLKGQLSVLVAESLRGEYEAAYRKNEKEKAAKLATEAEALLTRAKEFGVGQQAEDALFLLKNLSVGKVAPDIEGQDLDGKKFKLSEYRGKVVVLDFWAFW